MRLDRVAERIIKEYGTAILRNDSSCRTAICEIDKKYIRVSIVYSTRSVVFTEPQTKKQIIKNY